MDRLVIKRPNKSSDTILRTIRMSGAAYDKIVELAERYKLSFNCVANQILDYGLQNLDDEQNITQSTKKKVAK